MTKVISALTILILLAVGGVDAQEEKLELHLKTGNSFEGKLVKADEDGVTLDVDGLKLYFKWSYTRGDKHFELRKKATDFRSVKSVIKLADFCHEFAMDEQESDILVAAIKLDPDSSALMKRLEALPEIDDLDVPGKEKPVPEEPKEPEPEDPKPEEPVPTPTGPPYKVFVECKDNVAESWIEDHLKDYKYKIGHKRDYFVRLEVEVKVILIKNPKYYGAELYAIYDAELTYKMYKKGERKPFDEGSHETKNLRRNSRKEAIEAIRKRVLDIAFPDIYDDLEQQR